MSEPIKNVSAWRLNQAEKDEVARRTRAGEDEKTVTREIQLKKAEASRDRKAAAQAVADRAKQQDMAAKLAKGKAGQKKAGAPEFVQTVSSDDATNKSYYTDVQADCEVILAEYGKDFQQAKPLSLGNDVTGQDTGVQDAFSKAKAAQSLQAHSVYRCSISVWMLNLLTSATPSIPLSRRRVVELCEFHYGPCGEPKFITDRNIERGISEGELATDSPSGLLMISPEEIAHSVLAGCARAIKLGTYYIQTRQ